MSDLIVPPCSASLRLRPGDRCLLVQAQATAIGELLHSQILDFGLGVETENLNLSENALVAAAGDFDAVLLYQERPGEIPASLVEKLREAASNRRLLSVGGSWCEGELRTGKPWPEVERVYWHQVQGWLRGQMEASTNSVGPLFAVVNAVGRESASAMIDALQPHAIRGLWSPRFRPQPMHASVDVALWVGGQLDGRSADELAEYCRAMRGDGTPVLALLDFPRHDELRLAKQIGVADVAAKPWAAHEIAMMLRCLKAGEKNAQTTAPLPLPRLAA